MIYFLPCIGIYRYEMSTQGHNCLIYTTDCFPDQELSVNSTPKPKLSILKKIFCLQTRSKCSYEDPQFT